MKHTPGPWRVDPRNIGTHWNVGTDDQDVALASALVGDDVRQCKRSANARLIAAAPKMYELLERLTDTLDGIDEPAMREADELLRSLR